MTRLLLKRIMSGRQRASFSLTKIGAYEASCTTSELFSMPII